MKSVRIVNKFGQGEFDDGGAGLILQIRSEVDQDLHRGDRVVTVDYDKKFDIYHVVREAELVA